MPLIFKSAQLFQKKILRQEVKKVFSSRLNFWRGCTQNLARSQACVISSSHNLIVDSGFWIYVLSRFLSVSEECKTGLKGRAKVTYSRARYNHSTDASTLKSPVPLFKSSCLNTLLLVRPVVEVVWHLICLFPKLEINCILLNAKQSMSKSGLQYHTPNAGISSWKNWNKFLEVWIHPKFTFPNGEGWPLPLRANTALCCALHSNSLRSKTNLKRKKGMSNHHREYGIN